VVLDGRDTARPKLAESTSGLQSEQTRDELPSIGWKVHRPFDDYTASEQHHN